MFRIARIARIGLLVAAGLLAGRPASAQLFGSHGLDPEWCDIKGVRQTVLYIDDMMMRDGETDWVHKLDAKLKASLTPGERVTVVRLSPKTGQSHEEWSGCWPAVTVEIQTRSAGLMAYFRSSPADEVGEQQKYFFAAMGGALTTIYNSAKQPVVEIDPARPPPKQLLRSLASDDGRFATTQTVIRAIIYSDMAEQSDLGSAYKGRPQPLANYGTRLGSYLRHGVFYGFGVGSDVSGAPQFNENARSFWQAALHTMSASVVGMGADLNVPNILPTQAFMYPVELSFDGQPLAGQLTLLVGQDGTLVDSAINIQRLGAASLSGSYSCDAGMCSLVAETSMGIVTMAPSEDIHMQGSGGALAGKLGVPGQQKFDYPIKTGNRE